MFRFIHSADWQLGARFAQFGAKGTALREARLTTLRRALDVARERAVDAFIVAGDLFEDSQVDEALVLAVVQIFSDYPSVPIYLLPGNHDPFSGPDSVWRRGPFINAPSHIRILNQAAATEVHGAFLIASPLQQKMSTLDPSLKLGELAAILPASAIKIGVTHGALAIEGKHQPNDFPIALNAASRSGLDYLAVGHWHNWLDVTDSGRIVMPGTPEPDSFDHKRCGFVAYVEIDSAGTAPRIEPITVASLTWREVIFDFLSAEASRTTVTQFLSDLAPEAAKTVVRVVLTSAASPSQNAEVHAWLNQSLEPFLIGQISDRSWVALSSAELQDLQVRHPILAQVLADIDRIETLATGRVPVGTVSRGELIQCKSSGVDDADLPWDAVKDVVTGEASYRLRHPGVEFQKVCITNQYFNDTAVTHAKLNRVELYNRDGLATLLEQHPVTMLELERFMYTEWEQASA